MANLSIQDFARGSESFLAQAVGFIDGVGVDLRPCIAAVRILIVREDGTGGEITLPHVPGGTGWVPVEWLAKLLGCEPRQITVW